MSVMEKSDLLIVAMKRANKAVSAVAEPVEGSVRGAERNLRPYRDPRYRGITMPKCGRCDNHMKGSRSTHQKNRQVTERSPLLCQASPSSNCYYGLLAGKGIAARING